MYTKKDIVHFIIMGVVFVTFITGLVAFNLSVNDTDEIETNIDGYECITRIHYDNRIFDKDRQNFKTYCEKAEHNYVVDDK